MQVSGGRNFPIVNRSLPPRFITTRAIRRSEKEASNGRQPISPGSSSARGPRLFSLKGESERQERPAVAVLMDACGQSRCGGSVPDEQLSTRTRRSPNFRNDHFPLIASSVVIIAAMHERGVCGSSATPASHTVPQMPSRPKKGL